MAEAAAVCLEDQHHQQGVGLQIRGKYKTVYSLEWPAVTDRIRGSYDLEEATEYGACGVAILLMREQTGLTVQRALKGGGFDYWLGTAEGELPFQHQARLEVSGIRRGDSSRIKARVTEKLEQTHPSDGTMPAYVVVVEFGRPLAHVEKK